MESRSLAVLLLCTLLLAGCNTPAPPGDPPTTTSTTTQPPEPATDPPVYDFDGAGAHAYVERLVTAENGTPLFRVPGRWEHAAAADWLEETMAMDGWDVQRQSFTGAEYRELNRSGVEYWAESPSTCLPRDREALDNTTFHNLVATWGEGAPHVLLGAHWDSKEEASSEEHIQNSSKPVLGANDGASGVGVLLRLMEHIAAGDLDPQVGRLTVAFFDGEDGFEDCHPLAGSLYHAQNTDLLPDAMVLLDMVGDPDARFPREQRSMESAPGLMDLLWRHGARAGLEDNLMDEPRSIVDDHLSYIQQGVPAIDLVDAGRPSAQSRHGFPPYWHTTQDTMQNIDAGMLGDVGAAVATVLVDPALTAVLEDPSARLATADPAVA